MTTYVIISGLLICAGFGLTFALLAVVVDSRNSQNQLRAMRIVEWATERINRTYIQAISHAREGGRLKPEDWQRAHLLITDQATAMGDAEQFNVEAALGGPNSLAAAAWCNLARLGK